MQQSKVIILTNTINLFEEIPKNNISIFCWYPVQEDIRYAVIIFIIVSYVMADI